MHNAKHIFVHRLLLVVLSIVSTHALYAQMMVRVDEEEISEWLSLHKQSSSEPEEENRDTTIQTTLELRNTPVVYDSLIADWKFKYMDEAHENFMEEYINLDTSRYLEAIGTVTDAEYRRRLNNLVSPIHLPYNEIVRKYLLAYTTTHRGITQRMLGESKYYFPMIERELERQGLPLELKFLSVVESALNPVAVSRMGATGLWQFMLNTGRHYGLEISSMIDQRRDPEAATRAACAYLKELYGIYGDWTLAIASYNCGPGTINKALQRAGENAHTFWDIYNYLPRETRNYVPAFIALNYAYTYAGEHNIKANNPTVPLVTDTIEIQRNLHLEQVASTLNIPMDLLRILNPQYKLDIIPAAVKPYPLTLPQEDVCRFIAHEKEIYAKDSIYMSAHLRKDGLSTDPAKWAQTPLPEPKFYKVKKGDTLSAIGKRYGVSVRQLLKWNKLASANKLRIGQQLKVSEP